MRLTHTSVAFPIHSITSDAAVVSARTSTQSSSRGPGRSFSTVASCPIHTGARRHQHSSSSMPSFPNEGPPAITLVARAALTPGSRIPALISRSSPIRHTNHRRPLLLRSWSPSSQHSAGRGVGTDRRVRRRLSPQARRAVECAQPRRASSPASAIIGTQDRIIHQDFAARDGQNAGGHGPRGGRFTRLGVPAQASSSR